MRSDKKSLSEINATVQIPKQYNLFRRLLAFIGPAYLVSIGYMDPGNWATDIAGGSQFGYTLVWVLLMSNLMAVLLQSLSARLGIVTGMDLAQACAVHYKKGVNYVLWILTELAIIATDLAEVLGSAIGLSLLFRIPLAYGVIITALDTFIILLVQKYGVRKLEAIGVGLISIIGLSFLVEILLSKPDLGQVAKGFVPTLPGPGALFIATGILGATVMPHNLYLHSSLVQSRNIEKSDSGIRQAIKFNIFDSVVALNLAFFVNAAILVMAAAVFHRTGNVEVNEIQTAYKLLQPILGTTLAPILFGIALIASGQASTITGTLTGQIIMEGFINIRLQPWVRRLLTRLLAIIPALLVILYFGEDSTGWLLVLSQVILSLQLSFAVVPLIHLVSDKLFMKKFVISPWVKVVSWVVAAVIMALNIKLVIDTLTGMIAGGGGSLLADAAVLSVCVFLGGLLVYIVFEPLLTKGFGRKSLKNREASIHGDSAMPAIRNVESFKRIAVALDFTQSDADILSYAVGIAKQSSAVILMHVIESAGADVYGDEIEDAETKQDRNRLIQYAKALENLGIRDARYDIGYGNRVKTLAELIKKNEADIAVFGSHGHKGIKDLFFGITSDKVKDRVNIPIVIAK